MRSYGSSHRRRALSTLLLAILNSRRVMPYEHSLKKFSVLVEYSAIQYHPNGPLNPTSSVFCLLAVHNPQFLVHLQANQQVSCNNLALNESDSVLNIIRWGSFMGLDLVCTIRAIFRSWWPLNSTSADAKSQSLACQAYRATAEFLHQSMPSLTLWCASWPSKEIMPAFDPENMGGGEGI